MTRRLIGTASVDVLVSDGLGAVAAKHATALIPIVFAVFSQPVEEGLVASLARPGGNVTGLSVMAPDLAGKRLELLGEVVPGLRRMGIVCNPGRRGHAIQIQETQAVAARVDIHKVLSETASEYSLAKYSTSRGSKCLTESS